ncbi:PEP-CTERM protein-sorting domain-containing protein [Nitrosospira sp. Nsp18]|uniref:PEP-CTERM sorting domain-containing protein n=1 Tax=Nitrosospira sp. Nsp18 TaxID=1855334 RepID=UPI0008827E28|nr:PEP-CTERM sorting domain-containing protein [Nitrosospira sp. Nsp18]SDA20258.1 PEP-CTERM protein-sorting domain-containing protein [Nitrosospira sp. Nsp18]
MKKLLCGIGFGIASVASAPASAIVGYADEVVDYFDSGAGPIAGPYGGLGGSFPIPVPTSVVLGNDVVGSETFLSLPTDSYVTVRFTDEIVKNGAGSDIFIQEDAAAGEVANVYVSSDGNMFTFLGLAQGGVQTGLDLSSIGFTGQVNYVKVMGLDTNGGSPGFDVVNVQGLNVIPVPEPETYAMFLAGLGLMGFMARRRSHRQVS